MPMVSNAKHWHRMWSNRAAILAALLGLQEILPLWEGVIPDNIFAVASSVTATAVVFFRLYDQGLTNVE